jgi:3D (Asp-Asp-Asp) domain-containing protein
MDKILNLAKTCLLKDYLALKEAKNRVKPGLKRHYILILALITGISFGFFPLFHWVKKAQADVDSTAKAEVLAELSSSLAMAQKNSLLPVASPAGPEPDVERKMNVILTAYSSTLWETDNTPFITASGQTVRHGIVANNLLPFGTKIRIPEMYGDQIFIVEDRMKLDRGNYIIDIWFPSHQQAENFGAKRTYIEVLGS